VADLKSAVAEVANGLTEYDGQGFDRYSAWVEGLSFGIAGSGEDEWFTKEYYETCLKQSLSQLSSRRWSFDCPEFQFS